MKTYKIPLDKAKWLKEGFVAQSPQRRFVLGQGPFVCSARPRPKSLYHPDFFLYKKKPFIRPAKCVVADKASFESFLFETADGESEDSSQTEFAGRAGFFKTSKPPSFIEYQELFFQARQAFRKGYLSKLVPCLHEEVSRPSSVLSLLQNLFKKTHLLPHGFFYGFWSGRSGILGFTPELLFSHKGQEFETQAVAGTGLQPGPSLWRDKKELKEHDLVVKGIYESLKGRAVWREIHREEMPFPPLKHLRSKMKGRFLEGDIFVALCQALHPTPALAGRPQDKALEWLKARPSQKSRAFFGAPFGFFHSEKKGFCVIALRALEWDGQAGRIGSGAGLIAESRFQKEWGELRVKREQAKSFFRLPQSGYPAHRNQI